MKNSCETTSFNCSDNSSLDISSGITTVVDWGCSSAPYPWASFVLKSLDK